MEIQHSLVTKIISTPAIVHCSSVIDAGQYLLCVWYEGPYETSGETVIKIARKGKSDADWGVPSILFDFEGLPLGNPVLWKDGEGMLYVTFPVLVTESWTEGLLFYSSSGDGGRTWKEPSLFLSKRGFMPKTRPLVTGSGRILFPLYHEADFCPYVMIMNDLRSPLKSVLVAETMARGKVIQPAMVNGDDGKLLMFARTNQGSIWKSISYNDGYSWSIFEPTTLPNPNSALDLCRDRDKILLVYNHSVKDRRNLRAAFSRDGGISWYTSRCIVEGEGEYSYPSLCCSEDGVYHLTFTESRYMIRHAVFDADWVEEGRLLEPVRTE
jgi:alpha-L-fucosidase